MATKGSEKSKQVKATTAKAKQGRKLIADQRTVNPAVDGRLPARSNGSRPASQEQDLKRRLGAFTGTADHPRTSARSTGKFARSKKANTGKKTA